MQDKVNLKIKLRERFRPFAPSVLADKAAEYFKILLEFWEFISVRGSYWLLPVVAVLLILGLLIVSTEGSAIAPFVYTLW